MINDLEGVVKSVVIGLRHADFGEAVTVFFADELHRPTMGKVQKNVLRATYSS